LSGCDPARIQNSLCPFAPPNTESDLRVVGGLFFPVRCQNRKHFPTYSSFEPKFARFLSQFTLARALLSGFQTCLVMIEPLFSQPNYVAAKKMLDATALRQEAIASNLANIATPGYQRVDLDHSFAAELRRALGSKQPEQLSHLQPRLSVDASAVATRGDGNTVQLENELMALHQNTLAHTLETHLVSGTLLRLRLAITGRSA
jgi:flagellar basal-body rod protein FlgB